MAVKRPWRDIPTADTLRHIYDQSIQDLLTNVGSESAKIGKKTFTVQQYLNKFCLTLDAYHGIPKAVLKNFKTRAKALEKLAGMAKDFLESFQVDEQYQTTRGSKNDRTQNLARTILTIHNRGLAKANYLMQLEEWYKKGQGQAFKNDPRELVAIFTKERVNSGGLLGLVQGARFEALDPFHREFEVHVAVDEEGNTKITDPSGQALNAKFVEWFDNLTDKSPPFLVWLENTLYCTLAIGDSRVGSAVLYGQEKLQQVWCKVLILSRGSVKMMSLLGFGIATADTTALPMSKVGYVGYAAYVWAEDKSVYIAAHNPGKVHHSSFAGGKAIRCAGMIRIDSGIITFISSDSGHYQPSFQHMKNFGTFLETKGCIGHRCLMQLGGRDFFGKHNSGVYPWHIFKRYMAAPPILGRTRRKMFGD